MIQFLGSPHTSVGQSRSRCDFPLLVSALGSRDTPTCSDIQKHIVMFIVTTHATSPISSAPSFCSHFVPPGHNLTSKVTTNSPKHTGFLSSQVLHVSNRKSGSEATSLPLQRLSPHCPQPLSTYSFLITYNKARGKIGRGSLAHLIKATKTRIFPLHSCNHIWNWRVK